jgi:hypothetical protein
MPQFPVVTNGDALPFTSPLPVVRRRGQATEPTDDALATREIPSIQVATTLLPAIRLPQRRSFAQSSCPQPVGDLDELPTVLLPAAMQHDLEATALLPVPGSVLCSATPTCLRPEPMRFCYQCGAVIPPWRESCFAHERYHGRGLPAQVRLVPIVDEDVTARSTLPLPAICGL